MRDVPSLVAAVQRDNDSRAIAAKHRPCRTPSQSMTFARDGQVGACGLNRLRVPGRWPQQSVTGAWFGALHGSAPFMVPIHNQIRETMATRGPAVRLTVTTRATVLNSKVRRLRGAMHCNLVLPIDSSVEHACEAIRVNAEFDRVMRHVAHFAAYARQRSRALRFAVRPMSLDADAVPAMVDPGHVPGILITVNTLAHPQALPLHDLPAERLSSILECCTHA